MNGKQRKYLTRVKSISYDIWFSIFFTRLFCRYEFRVTGGVSSRAEHKKKMRLRDCSTKVRGFQRRTKSFISFFPSCLFLVVLNLTFGLLVWKLRSHTIRRRIVTSSYTYIVCCNDATRKLFMFVLGAVLDDAKCCRYWFYFVIYYRNFYCPCLFEVNSSVFGSWRALFDDTIVSTQRCFCPWNRSECFIWIRNFESR